MVYMCIHHSQYFTSMADVISRALKKGKFHFAQTSLLSYFNKHFPLPPVIVIGFSDKAGGGGGGVFEDEVEPFEGV